MKSDLVLKQPREEQGESNEKKNIDSESHNEVSRNQPRRDRRLFFLDFFGFLPVGFFGKRLFGRKPKRADAQHEGLAKHSDAAENGQLEGVPRFADGFQSVFHDSDGSVLPTDGHGIAFGRSHHDAFDDGLAADQNVVTRAERP